MPTIFETSAADVGHKFFETMAEWTNIGYFVSRKDLAFNCIGAALAVIAIIAALDVYVQQMCDLVDFAAVTVLGLSVIVADRGKNPKETACLAVATALYGVVQLPWLAYAKTEWFPLLISASSLIFSLCLLVVMYGRADAITYAPMVRASEEAKLA